MNNHGNSNLSSLLKILIFAAVLFFGGKYGYDHYLKPIDVTNDLKLTEKQLASKYQTSFQDNPSMVKQIPQYSKPGTTITVHSDATYDVIYANGVQIGVGTSLKRSKAYNVRWGYNEAEVNDNLTFSYNDGPSEVVSDLAEGRSTATFYANRDTNEGMVFVRNNTTNCVIYILYYSNIQKAMETLEHLW
ncbi:MAG: hypothetical protein E7294_16060 [Lachnospiraceae bacterium]|nr:hypothetical protein [Lachnospiraceae bacterium]